MGRPWKTRFESALSSWSPWRLRTRLALNEEYRHDLINKNYVLERRLNDAEAGAQAIQGDIDKLRDKFLRVSYERQVRDDRFYRISVTFSPELVGHGGFSEHTLDLVADRIGHQVAGEIRRAKFLDADRDSGRSTFPPWFPEDARSPR